MSDFNGNFGGSGGRRVEENPELSPLDEFGRERNRNEPRSSYDGGSSGGGRFGFGRGSGGSGGSGNGSWFKFWIAIVIIVILLIAVFTGKGVNESRRIIGTPQENLNSMQNAIVDLETVNKKEGKYDEVEDKNKVFHEKVLLYMPEKEYLIYVFTGDKKLDEKFNEFVKENQKDIKIYKIKYEDVKENEEIKLKIEQKFKPYLIGIKDMGNASKTVDAVISDEKQLKNVPKYFEDLVSENNFNKSDVHKYEKYRENNEE